MIESPGDLVTDWITEAKEEGPTTEITLPSKAG